MRVILQRAGLCVVLVASLVVSGDVAAGQVKYTYLKVGEGGGAQVYAFKSRQACETARRQHDANWAHMIRQLKKQIGNRGTFAKAPRTRCINTLPLGFVRPKAGK